MRRQARPGHRVYELPEGTRSLLIPWQRFKSFAEACARFPTESCLYAFMSPERTALYVGKAKGLRRRYSAACGALDALASSSNAVLFVAPIEASLLDFIEHTIIFWDCCVYNKRGRHTRPWPHLPLLHQFNGASSWWGAGRACEAGVVYEGPLFSRPGDVRDEETAALK